MDNSIADMVAILRRGDDVRRGLYPDLTVDEFFHRYTAAWKSLLADKDDLIATAAEEQASLRYAHHVMDVLEASPLRLYLPASLSHDAPLTLY